MSHAVEYLNYEGTLIHLQNDDSSVLHITHRVDNGQVTEKIVSEDAGRQIIRTDDEVTCIFPDQRTVLVEPRDDRDTAQSPLQGRLPGPGNINEALYLVSFAGPERIAGHDAKGIVIRPKDGFRYGYRLWLDRVTAMPLKTQLVDEQGRVIEQVFFSSISLPGEIPATAVQPSLSLDSFAVRRAPAQQPAGPAANERPWEARRMPPGFRLTVAHARVAPASGQDVRHVVYSDGLATVSLFVEPAVAASEQAEGLSQMGAANAYTTVIDGHMVTAVGEVPERTVEVFAVSARPRAAAR